MHRLKEAIHPRCKVTIYTTACSSGGWISRVGFFEIVPMMSVPWWNLRRWRETTWPRRHVQMTPIYWFSSCFSVSMSIDRRAVFDTLQELQLVHVVLDPMYDKDCSITEDDTTHTDVAYKKDVVVSCGLKCQMANSSGASLKTEYFRCFL